MAAKLRERTDNSHFSSAAIALINRETLTPSRLIRQFSGNESRKDCRLNFMHRARHASNKITLLRTRVKHRPRQTRRTYGEIKKGKKNKKKKKRRQTEEGSESGKNPKEKFSPQL
ncbi:hypothetical protein PUN28_018869 [Cardiocondyla obscurior]|uniref:Uncharacterized protein n=1 Tax=Cardiocondyla obscurior TaxID=286306 RepID=A0AAW2EF50_9HYME